MNQPAVPTSSSKPSSLQLAAAKSAAGSKLPTRRRISTRTSYEIGADTQQKKNYGNNSISMPPTQSWSYHEIKPSEAHLANHQQQHHHMTDMECESHVAEYNDANMEEVPTASHHPTYFNQMNGIPSVAASQRGNVPSTSGHGHTTRSFVEIGQTSYTIGGNNNNNNHLSASSAVVEKMTGVEDHGHKAPLVVLDGANIAHAYTTALQGLHSTGSGSSEPDATGILVATDFFRSTGVRVLVVLPQYWMRRKPRPGDPKPNMDTPNIEILNKLQADGLIVAAPPADDDDAYALTIARREESRSLRRNGVGPGYVLSNDMFRDAQARDTTMTLKKWLDQGRNDETGPGRISYSFADMGTMNDHGERILDFVPNPRHPLVIWMEGVLLSGHITTTPY